MANADVRKITGEFGPVKRICDSAELVWAVWQDHDADDGVGVMVVKGEEILDFIARSGVAEELTTDAVPCTSAEQAQALRQVLSQH